jgi:ABC-type sugar transport system ATPase subunit
VEESIVAESVVLETRNLTKHFGAVRAVQDVSIVLRKREILGLVGDNGAGKSTLLKILAGILQPTRGEIYVDNKKVRFKRPRDAIEKGIYYIPQEPSVALIEQLNVAENFFLNNEPIRKIGPIKLLNWDTFYKETREFIESFGLRFDPYRKVRELSGGERQLLVVVRALYRRPRILLLDEAVSALSVRVKEQIFDILRKYRDRTDASMIFVTHILEDALALCERIYVMRLGKIVFEAPTKEIYGKEELVVKMWRGE